MVCFLLGDFSPSQTKTSHSRRVLEPVGVLHVNLSQASICTSVAVVVVVVVLLLLLLFFLLFFFFFFFFFLLFYFFRVSLGLRGWICALKGPVKMKGLVELDC